MEAQQQRMSKNLRDHLMLYGTAWKAKATEGHVLNALKKGFRGIDCATQPKHYYQPGVGDGIAAAIKNKIIASRDDLWLQTKFTTIAGQDRNNMPYLASDSYAVQVAKSFAKALADMQTDYVDSLVLHGPAPTLEDTLKVWAEMEKIVEAQQTQLLGVSNFYDLDYFVQFYNAVRVKPAILQNRFYSDSGFDIELRAFCRSKGIIYQSFWTLTANPDFLRHAEVKKMSKKYSITPEAVLYRYIIERGGQPLNGTTSLQHMEVDLAFTQVQLDSKDVQLLNALIGDETA